MTDTMVMEVEPAVRAINVKGVHEIGPSHYPTMSCGSGPGRHQHRRAGGVYRGGGGA